MFRTTANLLTIELLPRPATKIVPFEGLGHPDRSAEADQVASFFTVLKGLGERNPDDAVRLLHVAEDGPPEPFVLLVQSDTVAIRRDDELINIAGIFKLVRECAVSKGQGHNRDEGVV